MDPEPSGTDVPPTRLVIKEMILENFKSYAGAQKIGPFHKCFSSVVGPNGSGKSNVIDGLLFVFGRRAKQLRFNKVSELIHNSTNHRNLQQARVSVHFVNIIDKEGDDFEIVPGSDLIVARTATRQNTSDYYINNKKVPVKEVTTLLKEKGIDLDNNRFLILQGEVEQISMMPPKGEDKDKTGLLEYLEDIIGTHTYIPLIEDAHKKLEELNDERQKAVGQLKNVERQKEGLVGKKEEAEAYLSKQVEMTQSNMRAYQLNTRLAELRITEGDTKTEELQKQLEHESEKLQKFDAEMKALEKTLKAAEKEHAQVKKEQEKAASEFSRFECKDAEGQTNKQHLAKQAEKLQGKIAADRKKLQKLQKEAVELEAAIPEAQEGVQRLTGELEAAQQVVAEMMEGVKGEVEEHRRELSKVREQLAPWEQQMQEVQSRIKVAEQERDMLAKRHQDAVAAYEGAVQGAEDARQAAVAKRQEIGEMQRRLQQLRQGLEAQQQALQQGQQREHSCQEAVRQLRGSVEQLRQEASSQQARGQALRALLEAKASGAISGLYGRLGDLGAVDPKYDVAASTAAGGPMEYILVENEEDARKGVELLRQKGLGRATFMIRLKQEEQFRSRVGERLQTPEGAPRLFDLVKYQDQRLAVAFYSAFRDTLVASDLTQATRIGYGGDSRFRRVVTLQGQLIESSGTMSGGGAQPRRGAICLGSSAPKVIDASVAAAQLQQAQAQLQQAQQELEVAQQAVREAAAAVRESEKEIKSLEVGLPKAQLEADAEEEKARDLQQRLAQLQQAAEAAAQDTETLQQLEKSIAAEQKAMRKLEGSTSGLRQQAEQLEAAIEDAGGLPLKKQRAIVEKLEKEIAELEASATKMGVQLKAHAKQTAKLQKDLEKQEAELERVQTEREDLIAELAAAEEEALVVLQRKTELEAVVQEKQVAADAARTERDQHASGLKVVKGVEAAIKEQLAGLQKERKEDEAYIRSCVKHMQEQQARLADLGGDSPMLEEVDMQMEQEELRRTADECRQRYAVLETELAAMNPDLKAIEEYRAKEAEYNDKLAAFEQVTESRDQTRKEYDRLRKERLDKFMGGFNIISLKLKEMYQMITLGGDAELELVDSLDPFSEGIVFSVRPPKKSWKNISNLSGGEKTLSSLSLVFALHHYKPTPLYVMDEIDAALDFKNVSIVGHYIKDRTKNAQFVIISLRNNMFELADRLVGIYKTDNCTKTIAINPGEFVVGSTPTKQAPAASPMAAQSTPIAAS